MKNRMLSRLGRFTVVVAIGGLSLGLLAVGCDKPKDKDAAGNPVSAAGGAAHGAVGVLDFEKVFTSLGWKDELTKQDDVVKNEMQREAQSWVNNLNDIVKAERASIAKDYNLSTENVDKLNQGQLEGLNLKKERQDEYVRLVQNYVALLQQLDPLFRQKLGQWEQGTLQNYKDAAKPAVRRAAASASVQVVFIAGAPGLYHYEAPVDITDKVIDEMKTPPPHSFPVTPKLELKPFKREDLVRIDKQPTAATTQPAADKK